VGTINTIEGIAAIGNAHFFTANAHYVFGSLKTWGWVVLCIGVIQLLVGLGVFAKNQLARWVGVFFLSLNMIAQLLMMPAYPFWSLSIFALDIIAIYGLVVHGKRVESAY
jgi:predicted Na+-dependent transporter